MFIHTRTSIWRPVSSQHEIVGRHLGRELALAITLCALLPTCGEVEDPAAGPEGIETQTRAIVTDPSGIPTGTTCGMSYSNNNAIVVDGLCKGVASSAGHALFYTTEYGDGDAGLHVNRGFFHQYSTIRTDVYDTNSANVVLPPGAVCGFKHTCNTPSLTCMGHDPAARDPFSTPCPPGWAQRIAPDNGNSSGCNFAWCAYLDLNGRCPSGNCGPSGLTCGLFSNNYFGGRSYCGSSTFDCPSGYTRHGWYDAGNSNGNGLGWCSKN